MRDTVLKKQVENILYFLKIDYPISLNENTLEESILNNPNKWKKRTNNSNYFLDVADVWNWFQENPVIKNRLNELGYKTFKDIPFYFYERYGPHVKIYNKHNLTLDCEEKEEEKTRKYSQYNIDYDTDIDIDE